MPKGGSRAAGAALRQERQKGTDREEWTKMNHRQQAGLAGGKKQKYIAWKMMG